MQLNLHWIDLAIIATYLLSLAGIGIFFSKRQFKLEEFLLAGRGMSWLPVGISLMAALNSGIDYVMQPAAVIKFGLVILVVNLSWLLLYPKGALINNLNNLLTGREGIVPIAVESMTLQTQL